MTACLLAGGLNTIEIVLISVGAAVGALSILWGVFRKFTRMSWGGWQVLVLFALTLLLQLIPADGNPVLVFCLTAGGFLGVSALLLSTGALLRRTLENHRLPVGLRVCDRILGGLTALVDWAVFAAAIGGFALVCCDRFGAVTSITESGVWQNALGAHAADVILVGFLLYAIKGGYKLGVLKSLFALLGLALTLVSFAGAVVLTIKWSFLHSFAGTVAGWFSLNAISAGAIGYFIVILIVFLIFFIVSMLLCTLLNLLLKRANRHPVFTAVDGAILSVFFFLFAAAFVCGVHYGVYALQDLSFEEGSPLEALEAVTEIFKSLGDVLSSSPLSNVFYAFNPIRLLA